MTLEAMQTELASLLDPMDIPGDWTPRQRESYESRRSWLGAKIQDATGAQATLDKVVPQIAALEEWRAFLVPTRATLCAEVMAMGKPSTPKEYGQRQNVLFSIQVIDRGVRVLEDTGYGLGTIRLGALMRAAGFPQSARVDNQLVGDMPFYGSLPVIEEQLKALTKERDDAQYRLAAALRDPEPATV